MESFYSSTSRAHALDAFLAARRLQARLITFWPERRELSVEDDDLAADHVAPARGGQAVIDVVKPDRREGVPDPAARTWSVGARIRIDADEVAAGDGDVLGESSGRAEADPSAASRAELFVALMALAARRGGWAG